VLAVGQALVLALAQVRVGDSELELAARSVKREWKNKAGLSWQLQQ